MNHFNYSLFEIVKYKIEFNEFLEYSLPTYEIDTTDISQKYNLIKSTYSDGLYKDIVSSLFENYEIVNKPIKEFLDKYTAKKIYKIIKKKKLDQLVCYNQKIIDCCENFNSIISSITEEKEISKIIDKKIIKLLETSNKHFSLFMFFNTFHTYIDCTLNKNSKIKFKECDMKNLVALINYCNKDNKFNNYIEILKQEDEIKLNKEIEKLSSKCLELEKKLNEDLKELIDILNKELEKSKN